MKAVKRISYFHMLHNAGLSQQHYEENQENPNYRRVEITELRKKQYNCDRYLWNNAFFMLSISIS